MNPSTIRTVSLLIVISGSMAACAHGANDRPAAAASSIGRHEISTIPFDPNFRVRSGTYTPSGKVLVSYATSSSQDRRQLNLATMDDDGRNMRPFFSGAIPERPKDNGIRFMVLPDDKRIFLGDFVIECATPLETCKNPALLPVRYPKELAGGDNISHRWSEIVVAPDNRHVAWSALLTSGGVAVFTGELRKSGGHYEIVRTQIVSTLDPFAPDPRHPDGVLPKPFLGGEVKQFVHGGTALSLVGAIRRDVPDTVVQSLIVGEKEAITDTPGYTETTIFSPDERLGMTMTTRFSKQTDPAILGLMPRPYPDSLQMDLSMFAYVYGVRGVRQTRIGNVGPALIEIAASKAGGGYTGVDLSTDDRWVFGSPMSWHPNGTKAMWMEGDRYSGMRRMRLVTLPDYRPAAPVAAKATPDPVPYASSDLSAVASYVEASRNIDVKVYGRKSGYITYRRTSGGVIDKTYVDFSDDGQEVYSGSERMEANPRGRSTYTAKVTLTGPKSGTMDLKMTFGPLGGDLPAQLIFSPDETGAPLTQGYAEYDGRRIDVDMMRP